MLQLAEKEVAELEASLPSQEEREQQRKVEDDTEADKKAEFVSKERDFVDDIFKLQNSYAVQPIGRDRMYRRYWVFNSVDGLFVETDEECVPEAALVPCKQNPNGSVFDINNPLALPPKVNVPTKPTEEVPAQKQNESRDGSDKENDSLNASGLNNSVLGDVNNSLNTPSENTTVPGVSSGKSEPVKANGGAIVISDDDDSKSAIIDVDKTSEEIETPAVKQIKDCYKHKWSFFSTPEDVDVLISSLNSRGFRENALKHALVDNKFHILNSVGKVQMDLLHIPEIGEEDESKEKAEGKLKTTEWKTRGKSVTYTKQNDSAHEGLELNLREMVLDLEERIHVGSLGYLRVSLLNTSRS